MTATTKALTSSEEITLRRVAYGQSDGSRMPARDLVRLRQLMLIDGDLRWPQLTTTGRRRFQDLAKPAALTSFEVKGVLGDLVARLRAGRRS